MCASLHDAFRLGIFRVWCEWTRAVLVVPGSDKFQSPILSPLRPATFDLVSSHTLFFGGERDYLLDCSFQWLNLISVCVCLVVWIRMATVGSCMWVLGPQEVPLLKRIGRVRSVALLEEGCQWGWLWGFRIPSQGQGVFFLLPMDQDVTQSFGSRTHLLAATLSTVMMKNQTSETKQASIKCFRL